MLTGNDKVDLGFGYHIGLITRIPFNELVSLAPTVTYARKGYNELGFFAVDEFYKQRLSYLDICLPLKFQIGNVFTFQVGFQTGILLAGELAYKTYDTERVTIDIKDDLSQVDLGLVLGAGFQFVNGVGMDFTINPGFKDVYENDPPLYYDPGDMTFFGSEFNGKNLLATINVYYLFGYAKPKAQ